MNKRKSSAVIFGGVCTRRRAEEAREALRLGLEKVRMIQEQAESVPHFRSRIGQLETELHQYRWRTGAGSTNRNTPLQWLICGMFLRPQVPVHLSA